MNVNESKWRKKPVVIEAHQWFRNGDHPLDYSKDHEGLENGEIRTFSGAERAANGWEGDIVRYYRHPDVDGATACQHCGGVMHDHGWIDTLEGGHIVCPGDWIITGVKGEVYPCKPDIFAATYEPADAPIIDLNAADFSDALMWLKEGKRVSRSGWNGKGMFLLLIAGGAWGFECDVEGVDGHVASAFICMKTADNKLVPWFASQTDLLSTDWQIYEEVVSDIPPHQLRVLEELAQLTDRLDKLTAFFDTAIYQSLDVDERGRLKEQCALMGELQRVLAERVAAF